MIIWITGAPGAGKTTASYRLAKITPNPVIIDADEARVWLTPDCDFTAEGRAKHCTRMWHMAMEVEKGGGTPIVTAVGHPPREAKVFLVWVDGPNRRKLWPGTSYERPKHPDLIIEGRE